MKTQDWQWAIAIRLGMIGSIGLSMPSAVAQSVIVPDNTLGAERSGVVSLDPAGFRVDVINGGAVRGLNLFHSFQEFNVAANRGVYFRNPNNAIQNILTRVTGNNRSEILGTLGIFNGTGVSSNPNLFLINPNGIIFGSSASLDAGGSFVATTANAIQFGDRGNFSASNPVSPSPILTVNPNAFLFNQVSHGAIVNTSTAPAGVDPVLDNTLVRGLRVADGHSLVLLGGDVSLDEGWVNAFGGRVELGGIVGAGTIALTIDSNIFRLSFPENIVRADIFLTNSAVINLNGESGGAMQVQAARLLMSGGSVIYSNTLGGEGGSLFIRSTDSTTVDDSAIITGFSNILSNAQHLTGKGGDIRIQAGQLFVAGDPSKAADSLGIISTSTFGNGRAGDLVVNVGKLILANGGQLTADTRGAGRAGNLEIHATESIEVNGGQFNTVTLIQNSDFFPSALTVDTISNASNAGSAGNLTITTPQLKLRDGARISSRTQGAGNGGNIIIQSGTLFTSSQALISGITLGSGNAGKIAINADTVKGTEGAQISTGTLGSGDAGNIVIKANNAVSFDGTSSDGISTGALSRVEAGASGKGGTVTIDAESLSLTNGAQLQALTLGQNDAGNVIVKTRGAVLLQGKSTGISTSVQSGAVGNVGDINIQSQSLSVQDGAQVQAILFREQGKIPGGKVPEGRERVGNIQINATDFVDISGTSPDGFSSGLLTSTERGAMGRGGNTTVTTEGVFRIANGATVNSQTLNPSDGGNITLNARSFEAVNGGQILTVTRSSGKAGTITLNVNDGSVISGSDSTFNSRFNQFGRDIVNNEGAASGLFASTNANSTGAGGNIIFKSANLDLTSGGLISAQSLGAGRAGDVSVGLIDDYSANDGQILAAAQGGGGNIDITAKNIRLRGNSDIRTNSSGGDGGNIALAAKTIVALENSDILAFAPAGKGGNIRFDTRAFLSNPLYRPTPPTTDRAALNALLTNGRVDVNASGAVSGVIAGVPDITFLQNGLNQLPANQIDITALLANSCIVRHRQNSSFYITGSGSLPLRPGDAPTSPYPTGELQPIPPSAASSSSKRWKIGDPIVEPQGAYQLPDGQLILSRECSSN